MLAKLLTRIEKLVAIIIKGVVFLLPLFFLPWTAEYFEFNKQFLLWLIMPVALILWLIAQAARGEIKIKYNPLNIPVIIFLSLTFISSLLSSDRFSSFFGYYGRFSDAWLGLLSLIIFYFLLINSGAADSAKKIAGLLKLFIYSAAAAALIALAAMPGAFKALAPDPRSILGSPAFNPAGGSLSSLTIFLGAAATLAAVMIFLKNIKKYERVLLASALAVFIIAIALLRPETGLAKIILGADLPKEAALAYKPALSVSLETIKKNPIFGSGPGTFARDFSLYRPAALNQNPDWQIRFDKNASQILEIFATNGVPAGLSYFLIICLIIYLNIILLLKYFKNKRPDDDFYIIAPIFTVFILLFFAQLFFAFNTLLNFCFWLFAGLAAAFWQPYSHALFKEKIIKLDKPGVARLALFLAAALWLALMAFEIKFFAADVLASRQANREKNLTLAMKLNPHRYSYAINLAKFYLNRAKNQADIADISRAIDAGKQAVLIAPSSVQANETLAMIYRDIRPLASGSEPWAVEYFGRALALEPANPALNSELAKAYFNINDAINAEKYFNLAISLKPDYYDAKFGLAKVYEREKKDGQALALLKELSGRTSDPEVHYELGRYFYNHKEIDQAIAAFKWAIAVFPNHSNGLYGLGLALEAKGEKTGALKYYEKVLELNPGNEEVIKRINNLKK